MTEGQRGSLQFLSLQVLLQSTTNDESAVKAIFSKVREKLQNLETVSVYGGVNRAIFREVALISRARMEANMGENPFGHVTILDTLLYVVGSIICLVIGFVAFCYGISLTLDYLGGGISKAEASVDSVECAMDWYYFGEGVQSDVTQRLTDLSHARLGGVWASPL